MTAIRTPCDEGVVRGAAPPAAGRAAERWVLLASILGSSMAFVDAGVVNVALPALQRSLGAGVGDVQWVIAAYSLFLAALLLLGGALGDRLGRKRVFAAGVALFAAASAACGLAPGIRWLIAARAVQGVGAALLVPGSLALIGAGFAPERRGPAIGRWSAWSAATSGIAPVLGGWLIEAASWRWIFWINLPLAALTLAIALARVPESRDPAARGALDWPGAALVTAGLGALVYGLIASDRAAGTAPTLVPIGVGVALLAGFVAAERAASNPLVPLSLFRARTFSGANLLTLFLYAAMGGALFFLPFMLIQVHGYGAAEAGGAMVPMIALMFLVSPWAGGVAGRHGARRPLVAGPLVAAAGYALLAALAGGRGSYWTTFFPGIATLGLGMAISVAPLTTTVMGAVPAARAGLASGVNNAVARTAGLLAVAVFGLAGADRFGAALDRRLAADAGRVSPAARAVLAGQRDRLAGIEIPPSLPEGERVALRGVVDGAFGETFRLVMLLAAGLAVGAGATAATMIAPRPPRGSGLPRAG
ncbi:MAG TPA: DHA2 family efflux MFS transporter permease subunit [Gemmatimonadales bacterium]|nr:DHA2 family efflux MFS transporter permease subunit [Gemmatimonadales bacterium]